MQYEVEKRSKLKEKSEFERVKNYLDNNAEFLGKKEMKSYLYQKPTFLRIRLIAGENEALITEKVGEYTEVARPEKEYNLPISKINEFVSLKDREGYETCSLLHTTRYSYKLNGFKVELNEIDYLGLIVEIEAITENQKEIPTIEEKIKKIMKKLNLEELNPKEYQKMMDYMYSQTLKSISEHEFKL
ncbi:MAG: CYTH domain-containing protein [Nanoarchaeota archaeon]|nr:CYTH domain-containing protein [Nanoarchaeota archaeon]